MFEVIFEQSVAVASFDHQGALTRSSRWKKTSHHKVITASRNSFQLGNMYIRTFVWRWRITPNAPTSPPSPSPSRRLPQSPSISPTYVWPTCFSAGFRQHGRRRWAAYHIRSAADLTRYQALSNQCKSGRSSVFDFPTLWFLDDLWLLNAAVPVLSGSIAWITLEFASVHSQEKKPATNPEHKPLLVPVCPPTCPLTFQWLNPLPLFRSPPSVSWRCCSR